MKHFFEMKLKVYEHELHRFLWISFICFCLFWIIAVFRNYVDTAFIKRYGVEHIPLMLVINGVLTYFLFDFMIRIGRRARDHLLLSGFLILYATAIAGFFFLIKNGTDLVYPALFQLLYLQDSVYLVYLWNISADFFDARQGKRLFPLITGSMVLGSALGSFCTRPLARLTGGDATLLFISGACLIMAIFIIKTAGKMVGTQGTEKKAVSHPHKKLSEIPGLVKKYPIIRYLIVVGLISNLLLPIFTYQFSIIANSAFPSEQALISFLGFFRGGMMLTIFPFLLFSGRLTNRFGVVRASFFYPVNISLIFSGLFAFFNIYIAALGQLMILLVHRGIAGPVGEVLFNIVPNELRNWSRVFIRSTVVRLGMMTGSLMMLALKPVMAPRYLAAIAVLLSIYWIIETIVFSRRYRRGLKQVIVENGIDVDRIEAACAMESCIGPAQAETDLLEENKVNTVLVKNRPPRYPPDVAHKLLADENPATRAEAALSLAYSKDTRAVGRITNLLDDKEVARIAAIEALVQFGKPALAFLESALMSGTYRSRRGILEVLRLSGLREFEITPFLGLHLTEAYNNLIAMETLAKMSPSHGLTMLRKYLEEKNREILSLVFHALWVEHADMRLMFEALTTTEASLAVELVETAVDKNLSKFLIPLIDAIPVEEKIDRGCKVLPLMRVRNPERMLTWLAGSRDTTTRMLAAYVIGDYPAKADLYPTLENLQNDPDDNVRHTALYAVKRFSNEVIDMPEVIETLDKLKDFIIFDGMGIRELQAIATITTRERFEEEEIIIAAGDENFSLHLLLTGRVRIYTGYGTPEEAVQMSIGPGGFMGELRLFTEVPDRTTCIALEPVEVLVIARNHFQEIMRIYPQIGMNLCLFFALRLFAADIQKSGSGL
jgi:HEAT repeat protein/ATP/ADP translocase